MKKQLFTALSITVLVAGKSYGQFVNPPTITPNTLPIATGGSVGIGIAAPKSLFDVIGNSRFGTESAGDPVDANTAVFISASNTPTGAKVRTWNNGLKAFTVENTNFTNAPFTVFGDGSTVINAGWPSL